MTHFRSEGRGNRPGLRVCQRGSVTVEASAGLLVLTAFFCVLVSGLGTFGAELALTSLARDAARAASLQPGRTAADAAVQRVLRNADGVRYSLSSDGEFVTVALSKPFRVLRLPGALALSARASAYEESPW